MDVVLWLWTTEDNKHLWGRNFDFNCIAEESKIIYIPKGKSYYGCGTRVENNIVEKQKLYQSMQLLEQE